MTNTPEPTWYVAVYWRHWHEYLEIATDLPELVDIIETKSDYDECGSRDYWQLIDGEWVELDVSELIAERENRQREQRQAESTRQQEKHWQVVILGPGGIEEKWSTHHTQGEAEQAAGELAGLPTEVRPR